MRDDRVVTRRAILALAGAAGLGVWGPDAFGQRGREGDEGRREGEDGGQAEDRRRPRPEGIEPPPGRLARVTQSGDYQATVGDVIEVAVPSNPTTGPSNPAASLRVDIEGQGLSLPFRPVFAPPARPIPGAPGEIRAYLLADRRGEAQVTVTPISGMGQPGSPLKIVVRVAPRDGEPERGGGGER